MLDTIMTMFIALGAIIIGAGIIFLSLKRADEAYRKYGLKSLGFIIGIAGTFAILEPVYNGLINLLGVMGSVNPWFGAMFAAGIPLFVIVVLVKLAISFIGIESKNGRYIIWSIVGMLVGGFLLAIGRCALCNQSRGGRLRSARLFRLLCFRHRGFRFLFIRPGRLVIGAFAWLGFVLALPAGQRHSTAVVIRCHR